MDWRNLSQYTPITQKECLRDKFYFGTSFVGHYRLRNVTEVEF